MLLLMRTRRNTFAAPVTMLPVEVLSRIFSLLVSVYPPGLAICGDGQGMDVSHPCVPALASDCFEQQEPLQRARLVHLDQGVLRLPSRGFCATGHILHQCFSRSKCCTGPGGLRMTDSIIHCPFSHLRYKIYALFLFVTVRLTGTPPTYPILSSCMSQHLNLAALPYPPCAAIVTYASRVAKARISTTSEHPHALPRRSRQCNHCCWLSSHRASLFDSVEARGACFVMERVYHIHFRSLTRTQLYLLPRTTSYPFLHSHAWTHSKHRVPRPEIVLYPTDSDSFLEAQNL
ncbi:hypothetical protein BV25DRAFT_1291814 [Artomyces pyxidatus]|uniref:Uncharacterized protein n=1 Tax=Artomyces pyxidatus TaxID=48021 RepID=A0ACB8SNX8_9AGAM|nr:hypothetical protein BV25DRAFT_1291814 [Artomyces pyxidatus]